MTDKPNFLSIPKFLFLMNGGALESAAVAAAIIRDVPKGCIEFFEEPLTAGIVGLFYGDSPYDGYIAFDTPEALCNNSSFSLGNNRSALRGWLEGREGREILGRIARERLENAYELFSNFVFPDALHGLEIVPLMRRFPNEGLLVLARGMTVPSALSDGPIDIMFATPQETLAQLSARKESAA